MNSNWPLVSVIVPTYQRPDFLVRAVQSVLNQSYQNIEIIVVDDNHKNDSFRSATKQKIEEFTHPIIYIEHEKNMGVVQARNTGILNAHGEYIAFLDDDDEWLPLKLEIQVKLFDKLPNKYGLLYCGWIEINETTGAEKEVRPKFKGDLSQILGINHVGSPSVVLCKSDYVRDVGGFNSNIIYRADLEFYYRLSKICYFDYVPSPLVNYYIHSGSESRDYAIRLEGMLSFLKIYSSELKANKVRWSEILERLGELYILNNQQLKSIESFSSSFFNRPLRMEILGKLLLSFLGSSCYIRMRKF